MQRDDAYLFDILDSARIAVAHLGENSWDDFLEDVQLQDAVIRRLEIIGEAARRVSDTTKAQYPRLLWQKMIGMRNFLIHQYDEVNLHTVWDVVVSDLPVVISELEHVDDG